MQTTNMIIIASTAVLLHELLKKGPKKRPSFRVNPYLQERNEKGRFATDVSVNLT